MTVTGVSGSAEVARQRSVAAYGLAGADAWDLVDPELTQLAVLAQQVLNAQACAINILDEERQWSISASPGVPVSVSRGFSLCDRVLARSGPSTDVFVTADASRDPLLADSPSVNGDAGSIRFFAAAPLIGREGLALGTVCMWSEQPYTPTEAQLVGLAEVRDAVLSALDARRRTRELTSLVEGTSEPFATQPAVTIDDPDVPADRWSIDAVIDDRAVRTVFQPVVHLASGTIAGFEALSRGPVGSSLESPMALIDAATATGRLAELDWLCRVHAMQAAVDAGLDRSLSWLINVEPAGLAIDCPPHLQAGLAQARAELRVILEVVERDVEGFATALLHATDQARRDSWGVALDDVGAEEGSLALLPFLRPDVVKLDMSLVRGVPRLKAAEITAAVRAYAERTGAVILAEGIETEEQERLAQVFGATYGQGYRYGRPGPLPASVPAPRHVIPLRQRLIPLDGQTPFEVLTAKLPTQRAAKQALLHISQHLEEQITAGNHASVLLAGFQDRAYFSPMKRQRYQQLSRLTALTVVLAEGLATAAEPQFHVGPLQAGSRMGQEWVVIVIKPHYAAAFVAKDCGDEGRDGDRRFDYGYTHDRDLVIAAARSYLQELVIHPDPTTPRAKPALGPRNGFGPASFTRTPKSPKPTPAADEGRGARTPRLPLSGPLASAALDALPDATAVIDQQATIIAVNHTWRMFAADNGGDPASTGVGVNYLQVCERAAAAGSADAEAMITAIRSVLDGDTTHADLEYPCPSPVAGRWFMLRIAPLAGPTPGAVISHVNITRRKMAEQALEHEAVHDPLTGLANRALFTQRLEHALTPRPGRLTGADVGVLYLDLDGFKTVNDAYGHDAGDELLMSAAHRLTKVLRAGDTAARLGGDEFAVLAPRITKTALTDLAQRITHAMAQPYLIHGHPLFVPASVGARLARPGEDTKDALRQADEAMYTIKKDRPRRSIIARPNTPKRYPTPK
jgi:diguanylate cyclase (GGDEF)-like protein